MPRKNLCDLGGRPLLAWTVEAAKRSNVARVVVSTEDAEIVRWCEANGVECVERPPELAADHVISAPVVLHALDCLRERGYEPTHVLLLHPTSPFRTAQHINEALGRCLSGVSVISVTGDRLNGAIYVSQTDRFRRNGTFFAPLIWPLEMDARAGIDIDTPEDLERARAVCA